MGEIGGGYCCDKPRWFSSFWEHVWGRNIGEFGGSGFIILGMLAIGRVYWKVLEAGWREGILREVLTVWLVRFQCRARDLSGMELEAICVIAWQEIRLHSAHILRI